MHHQQFFKTWWEKEKLLVRSNFNASTTVFENIVGKAEIARNEQFLLFPQRFLLNQMFYPHLFIFLKSYLYLRLNWKSLKLAYQVKGRNCRGCWHALSRALICRMVGRVNLLPPNVEF